MTRLTSDTLLTTLGFAHLDVVLEEIFGVAPRALFPTAPRPATVGELAAHAERPVDEVVRRLEELLTLQTDPEISAADLKAKLTSATPPVLIDVREPWEFDVCHLPGSILLATTDFAALLPRLVAAPEVVTICHHGVRSYSAAMFLREKGVRGARSLAGGLDHWAKVIDPTMARY